MHYIRQSCQLVCIETNRWTAKYKRLDTPSLELIFAPTLLQRHWPILTKENCVPFNNSLPPNENTKHHTRNENENAKTQDTRRKTQDARRPHQAPYAFWTNDTTPMVIAIAIAIAIPHCRKNGFPNPSIQPERLSNQLRVLRGWLVNWSVAGRLKFEMDHTAPTYNLWWIRWSSRTSVAFATMPGSVKDASLDR
jgi:hypothetical protein